GGLEVEPLQTNRRQVRVRLRDRGDRPRQVREIRRRRSARHEETELVDIAENRRLRDAVLDLVLHVDLEVVDTERCTGKRLDNNANRRLFGFFGLETRVAAEDDRELRTAIDALVMCD